MTLLLTVLFWIGWFIQNVYTGKIYPTANIAKI